MSYPSICDMSYQFRTWSDFSLQALMIKKLFAYLEPMLWDDAIQMQAVRAQSRSN